MKKHVKAMTYKPKIPAVRSGECRQTIRPGSNVRPGDQILIHGWTGRPYRSKWSWRKRIEVLKIINIRVFYTTGIQVCRTNGTYSDWCRWDSPEADELAALDFIDPPKGWALRSVLFGFNMNESIRNRMSFKKYQIIRW